MSPLLHPNLSGDQETALLFANEDLIIINEAGGGVLLVLNHILSPTTWDAHIYK